MDFSYKKHLYLFLVSLLLGTSLSLVVLWSYLNILIIVTLILLILTWRDIKRDWKQVTSWSPNVWMSVMIVSAFLGGMYGLGIALTAIVKGATNHSIFFPSLIVFFLIFIGNLFCINYLKSQWYNEQ